MRVVLVSRPIANQLCEDVAVQKRERQYEIAEAVSTALLGPTTKLDVLTRSLTASNRVHRSNGWRRRSRPLRLSSEA